MPVLETASSSMCGIEQPFHAQTKEVVVIDEMNPKRPMCHAVKTFPGVGVRLMHS